MINIQWTKFEQKSIGSFISGELPKSDIKVTRPESYWSFLDLLYSSRVSARVSQLWVYRNCARYFFSSGGGSLIICSLL